MPFSYNAGCLIVKFIISNDSLNKKDDIAVSNIGIITYYKQILEDAFRDGIVDLTDYEFISVNKLSIKGSSL